jgi:uncharacterized protein (DUF1499 family)
MVVMTGMMSPGEGVAFEKVRKLATPEAEVPAGGAFALRHTAQSAHRGTALRFFQVDAGWGALTLAMLLGACASPVPAPQAVGAPASGSRDLACSLPSNCVNSLGTGGFVPLRYVGTPEQALAMLQATLTAFPEATVVRSEPLALEVIFTTPVGFRDQVDFQIYPQGQRIDFRSRSLFGLFDWGKNRSRMQAFKTRFEQQPRP